MRLCWRKLSFLLWRVVNWMTVSWLWMESVSTLPLSDGCAIPDDSFLVMDGDCVHSFLQWWMCSTLPSVLHCLCEFMCEVLCLEGLVSLMSSIPSCSYNLSASSSVMFPDSRWKRFDGDISFIGTVHWLGIPRCKQRLLVHFPAAQTQIITQKLC